MPPKKNTSISNLFATCLKNRYEQIWEEQTAISFSHVILLLCYCHMQAYTQWTNMKYQWQPLHKVRKCKRPTALRGSHFFVCVCLSVTRVLTCESRKAHQDKRANYQCPVLLAPEQQTWDAPAAPTAWTCDPQVRRHVSVCADGNTRSSWIRLIPVACGPRCHSPQRSLPGRAPGIDATSMCLSARGHRKLSSIAGARLHETKTPNQIWHV